MHTKSNSSITVS